jgi:CubicO group peptidase (beta-lactamase class C family)
VLATWYELNRYQSLNATIVFSTDITPEDVVKSLAYLKPSAPFRSCYQYTNLTYVAASLLPKQVLGQHLDGFVKGNLWDPLGMTQSHYNIEVARSTGNLSSGFARKLSVGQSGVHDVERCKEDIKHARGKLSEEGRGMEHSLGWPVQQLAGPGGVITCAKDLVS